jgi:hypothetical protein
VSRALLPAIFFHPLAWAADVAVAPLIGKRWFL